MLLLPTERRCAITSNLSQQWNGKKRERYSERDDGERKKKMPKRIKHAWCFHRIFARWNAITKMKMNGWNWFQKKWNQLTEITRSIENVIKNVLKISFWFRFFFYFLLCQILCDSFTWLPSRNLVALKSENFNKIMANTKVWPVLQRNNSGWRSI